MGSDLLEAIVGGNAGISLALLLLVGVPAWRRRRKLARVWRDPDPRWRRLARLALALQVLAFVWVTLADYWRQLLGLPMRAENRRFADPFTLAPVLARHAVPDAVRAVTLALLILAALALALLCYHQGLGVFVPLCALVAGLLAHLLLSQVRWQFDIWVKNTFPVVGQRGAGGMLADLVFFALALLLAAVVCLAYYLALTGLLALPVALVGDRLAQRRAAPAPEYQQFAATLRARAAASRDERGARTGDPLAGGERGTKTE